MEEERLRQLIEVPEWKTILLDLVEKNEIDPWNVDIVRLTDLYLEEIKRRKESDLFLPANAVLASSILLWLKSRVLREIRENLEEQEEAEVVGEVEPVVEDFVAPLEEREEVEVENVVIPPNRFVRRTVTLDELLDVMEKLMKKGVRRVRPREIIPEVEEFFEEMEEEDVEDYVEVLYAKIREMADSEGSVLLSSLTPPDGLEFVKTLLAVLYLANNRKVDLFQERIFGDIVVKIVEAGRVGGE